MIVRGKGGKQLKQKKTNILAANRTVYEFRKTARQEAADPRTVASWDSSGRFVAIHGQKGPGLFENKKSMRSVRLYSIFGEPLQAMDKIPELGNF